jgi:hypothetical protein
VSFEVTHWNGHDYVFRKVGTFDEVALYCGATGQEILRWRSRMAALGIDEIRRENAQQGAKRFSYLEVSFFATMAPYGFRYAPKADPVAQRELLALTRQPPAGLTMRSIGGGWFYFEGLWAGDDFPFTRER